MSVAPSTVGTPIPLGVCPPCHRCRIGVSSRIVVSVVALTLCWSCGGGATDVPEETPGRPEFIGAYLDLRTAALISGSPDLGNEVRDSILAVYDVTDQDLLDFIETHGEDVEFMRDLWTEIEGRVTERLEQNALDEENEGTEEDAETEEIQDGDAGISP